MEVKYYPDSDTLLIDFSNKNIIETREINEDITMRLDNEGDLVSMTIKHAKRQANIDNFSYNKIEE